MLSKATIGVAAAGVGLFLAYCVYFDKKRRSDPEFKNKLRQKRTEQRKKKQAVNENDSELPDLRDYEQVQKFFIQEVQLGEEMLGMGDVENGVEHLSNAVAVCGQPHQLLQVLQQTLPPQVFQLLLQRLPIVSQKLTESMSPMGGMGLGGLGGIATMSEDDVE